MSEIIWGLVALIAACGLLGTPKVRIVVDFGDRDDVEEDDD